MSSVAGQPGPHVVEGHVAGDPEEPGGDRAPARVVAGAVPPGAQEGVLCHLLGGLAVARHRQREPDHELGAGAVVRPEHELEQLAAGERVEPDHRSRDRRQEEQHPGQQTARVLALVPAARGLGKQVVAEAHRDPDESTRRY